MERIRSARPLQLLGAATLAAGVLLACRAGTEPNLAEISGSWDYVETFTNVQYRMSCVDSGTYTLRQAGEDFVGEYGQRGVCRTPTGNADNADSGSVSEGHVVGRTLRFRAPNCAYDGAVDDTAHTSITGRVECVLTDPNPPHLHLTFSGTWQASR